MMDREQDVFLSPEEVHEYTGVAVQTLANWRSADAAEADSGKLTRGPRSVKMLGEPSLPGGRVGYWKSDVDVWLKAKGFTAGDMSRYLAARRARRAA